MTVNSSTPSIIAVKNNVTQSGKAKKFAVTSI